MERGLKRVEGVSMRHQADVDEAWEYSEGAGLHRWTVGHVVGATLAAALIWFAVVYTLTLIIDWFV
jgi:hypothetical protein